jgi:hypothetical protein
MSWVPEFSKRAVSGELSSVKINEKIWQGDSLQLRERIGWRVPELAVDS